jgi:hypothetical protein
MIPKMPALGLDPRVGAGFRKRSCSKNKIERDDDSKKSHRALTREQLVDDQRLDEDRMLANEACAESGLIDQRTEQIEVGIR